jgi:hypothetical protein
MDPEGSFKYGFQIRTLRAVCEIRTLGTKYGPRLAVSKYTDSGVHQIRQENRKKTQTLFWRGVVVYTVGTIWSKFVCSGDSRIVYFVLISRCSAAGISKLDLGGGGEGGRGKGKVRSVVKSYNNDMVGNTQSGPFLS